MAKHVFNDESEEHEFEKEMKALFDTYKPLFDEAMEQDFIDLAGRKPKDYDGNVNRLRREFNKKYKDIRSKYGMSSDGRPE